MKKFGFGRRDNVVQVAEDEHAPYEMPGLSDAITMRQETWAEILLPAARFTVLYIIGAALTLLALYAILASTLLFVAHVNGDRVYVARTTYPGGIPTLNTEAYVSTAPDSATLLGNLQTGFVGAPQASLVRVHSGPYDTVSFDGTQVAVNGRAVGQDTKAVATPSEKRLSNQYLVECIDGACAAAHVKWLIVPSANVYGEVRHGW